MAIRLPLARPVLVLFLAQAIFAPLHAAESEPSSKLATVSWSDLKERGALKAGEVVQAKEGEPGWLRIVQENAGTTTHPLCEVMSPPIKSPSYAIRGRIRYQNVTGTGFLEMWSHFGGDQSYFFRTLGDSGPMESISGTSPERSFELPFHTGSSGMIPKKLSINLILKGPGTVEIGPLELVPIEAIAFEADSGAGWWSHQTAGLIGGIGGSCLGLLGGLVGTLVGLGRAKNFVLGLAIAMAAIGATFLAGGIAAVFNHQPFTVYYVLLMIGGMTACFGGTMMFVAPARYRAYELRRMQALDV